MANRRILSYVLFVVGLLILALLGLQGQAATGIPLGAAFLIVGLIFYRRGK